MARQSSQCDDIEEDLPEPSFRFGELSKTIPVGCVGLILIFLYSEYVLVHCVRLLQLDLPSQFRVQRDAERGATELAIFHINVFLILYCLFRCILTSPGTVPSTPAWDLRSPDQKHPGGSRAFIETKVTGERRHCKWCLKFKPDRTHHCRVCNVCVLRMDHHCPWVYNCIGFKNHKYFVLLLVYTTVCLWWISVNMFDSVWWATRTDVQLWTLATLIAGELLATTLLVISTAFLGFHIWLMLMGMTTVEFCEKKMKKTGYNSSMYSEGVYKNICNVLGSNPLFWLVPLWLPTGDGMTHPCNVTERGKKGSNANLEGKVQVRFVSISEHQGKTTTAPSGTKPEGVLSASAGEPHVDEEKRKQLLRRRGQRTSANQERETGETAGGSVSGLSSLESGLPEAHDTTNLAAEDRAEGPESSADASASAVIEAREPVPPERQ